MTRSILALMSSALVYGLALAQDQPLVDLPKDMKPEQAMQAAQSSLVAGGWLITSNQSKTNTIEAQDRNSRIRLYVVGDAIRYRDLSKESRESFQRNRDRDSQPLDPIPTSRIAQLRTELTAALDRPEVPGKPSTTFAPTIDTGERLLGDLPRNLSNEQILRVVWSALAGRRWVVKPGDANMVIAEQNSMDTIGRLKVFIVGGELRYTDEGTKSRSSGAPSNLPDNWIMNLRADTARGLRQASSAPSARPPAASAPPPASSAARTAADRLRVLKELHDSGAITRDEYEKKRAEVLRDL